MRGVWSRVPLAIAVVVQLVVLYAPRAPSTDGLPGIDKVVHLTVFAAVAWTGRVAGVSRRLLAVVLVAHAVLSEVVQGTVLPHRSGDPLDALADTAGILLGLVLPLLGRPARGRRPARTGRLGRWGSTGGR